MKNLSLNQNVAAIGTKGLEGSRQWNPATAPRGPAIEILRSSASRRLTTGGPYTGPSGLIVGPPGCLSNR